MLMRLVVVLPTYNEATNLPNMVRALRGLRLPDADLSILIVDDNSPDGTGQLADSLCRQHPGEVRCLHRAQKDGLGRAYLDGFREALSMDAHWILQMDCDFSHRPEDVSLLWEARDAADMVLGSRFVQGGSVDPGWPAWRKALSGFANRLYVPTILRLPVKDATGGFRLWKRDTLVGMDPWSRVRSNSYAFQIEMAYIAHRLGYRIVEAPIFFPDRVADESKMDLSTQVEAACKVFQMRWRYRKLRA